MNNHRVNKKRDTTLRWGPTSNTLPALIAWRDRLARYLTNARAKQDQIAIYERMIPTLEAELIVATVAISEHKRTNAAPRKVAA